MDCGSVCPPPVMYATINPPRVAGVRGLLRLMAPVAASTLYTAALPTPLPSAVNNPGELADAGIETVGDCCPLYSTTTSARVWGMTLNGTTVRTSLEDVEISGAAILLNSTRVPERSVGKNPRAGEAVTGTSGPRLRPEIVMSSPGASAPAERSAELN